MESREVKNRIIRFGVFFMMLLFAMFAIAYLATSGKYTVEKTVEDAPSLPYIEINGYRFHGETFGEPEAPVVIVVHGGPGWDYRSLLSLQALADEYYVVFFDQRGTGLSPRVDESEFSLDSALADLDAIVDRFRGARPVTLIGHSWGAMLVTAYLGRAPHKVSHAVLAEPGFINSAMFDRAGLRFGPRWEADYLLFAVRRWFESLHIDKPDAHAAMDYFMAGVAARANPEYYCNDTVPEKALEHWRAGATAMGTMFASSFNDQGGLEMDFTVGLERFTKPVLLLASECNSLIGMEHQKLQSGYFPNARLYIIPRSGHMMFIEQPEVSLSLVRQYLRSVQ